VTGIADIASRMQVLQTLIAPQARPAVDSASSSTFAAALAQAQGPTEPGRSGGAGPSGQDVVAGARRYIGVPYVWGGTNPDTGLDCSGLVQRVYADLGVTLPRVSGDQARAGTPVAGLVQARPGDVLAFGHPVHHVAIYLGGNQMIAAPEAGDHVRVQRVYETPTAIRRILPDNGPMWTLPVNRPAGIGGVPYSSLFASAGARYGLPPGLLAAVAKVESGYNPRAVSSAGAQGLMQLMPGTAAGLGVDAMNPAQAVDGAARLLARDLADFKTLPLALAAYNAGAGAVRRYGGIPPYAETQAYVGKVQAAMATLTGGGSR
jgi:hypothetical protein